MLSYLSGFIQVYIFTAPLTAHMTLSSLEICAGAGGQALGLELAGFDHAVAVEIDPDACNTLRHNRPSWRVLEGDVRELIRGKDFTGIDLFAGGVPCPPFSVAGRQLGPDDERDLFPTALQIIEDARPNSVILENVPGLATAKFSDYRDSVRGRLERMGYVVDWRPLNACDFGVPQLRPRFVLVALKPRFAKRFVWPSTRVVPPTVGHALEDLMSAGGWAGVNQWVEHANGIAPTLVGGSKKHGGPDLGPTRAKQRWAALGVDGHGLANEAPGADYPLDKMPRLTVRMAARIQGFPDSWHIMGKKTASYRQVGNAFPPPVAEAIGKAVHAAITGGSIERQKLSA